MGPRTPWSRAAALAAAALTGLQLDALTGPTQPAPYQLLVVAAGAAASGLAALGLATRNGTIARAAAAVVAAAAVTVVLLLVTVGPPGADPRPLDLRAEAILLLGGALATLVALDRPLPGPAGVADAAAPRVVGGPGLPLPIPSGGADSCAARRGRPGHRTHPGQGARA
jgi:hypothetical protein